jgi:hypothetical protein
VALPPPPPPAACAVPINFRQIRAVPLNNGALYFEYQWDSTSGSLSDLSLCHVGETVFYPNYPETPYIWPLPMVQSTPNPTIIRVPANGILTDTNSPPNNYQMPYFPASFQATQRFWWSCPCYQGGNVQHFAPELTITRQIFKDADSKWKYRILKSGKTNVLILPGQ